jgi:hypothetical protein
VSENTSPITVTAKLEGSVSAQSRGREAPARCGGIRSRYDLGALALKNIERPVRAYRVRGEGAAEATPPVDAASAVDQPLLLPDKPSIAVLPFLNMTGDPDQKYFNRRHYGRHHHRAVALPFALRDRPTPPTSSRRSSAKPMPSSVVGSRSAASRCRTWSSP